MGALLTSSVVEAQQAQPQDAQAAPVPPQGTILSPIVIKTPRNAGPSAPPSQPSPAAAAPTAPAATPSSFDALSTISEKSAATVYDSPGTVTVKSTAEMERQNINNAREFVRDEPGLSVGNQPGRTGATNFVIRGIGENRVRLEIDGVKVPDFPGTNIGAGTYTRDFIDYESLKRIEIVRGPASALYGSDALGGVVAFITKDPSDYLDLVKKDWYVSLKGGFDSLDSSVYSTVTGASRVGPVESLVVATRRWGHEVDINSRTRDANPQDYTTSNVLGKVVYNTYGAGQIKLTGEFFGKRVETQLNSESGVFLDQFARVFSGEGDDTTYRRRGSVDWTLPVNWWAADVLKTKLYATSVHREEFTDQLRASYFGGPPPATRDAAAADGPLLRPGHRRRRGAGDRSPQVLGRRPLLHLRRHGRLHHHGAPARPLADNACHPCHDQDGGGRDVPQQELPRHRNHPGGVLHPGHRPVGAAAPDPGRALRLLQPDARSRISCSPTPIRPTSRSTSRRRRRSRPSSAPRSTSRATIASLRSTRAGSGRRPTTTPTSASATPRSSTRSCPTATSSPRPATASRRDCAGASRAARASSSRPSTTSITTSSTP